MRKLIPLATPACTIYLDSAAIIFVRPIAKGERVRVDGVDVDTTKFRTVVGYNYGGDVLETPVDGMPDAIASHVNAGRE